MPIELGASGDYGSRNNPGGVVLATSTVVFILALSGISYSQPFQCNE